MKPGITVTVLDTPPANTVKTPTTARGRGDDRTRSRAVRALTERMRAEYVEMPGLSITLPQAQRLWTVDQASCEEAFSRLIASGVLRKTTKGRFVRA